VQLPGLDNLKQYLYTAYVQVVSGEIMMIQTTYTHARANLASIFDKVTADREIVIVQRRGEEDVALISATELSSLMETAHLLRSPKNAERLQTALARAQQRLTPPQTVTELRNEVGLDEAQQATGR
jgi:antitoxin YefM